VATLNDIPEMTLHVGDDTRDAGSPGIEFASGFEVFELASGRAAHAGASRKFPHSIISCSIAHPTASHYNPGTWQTSTAPAFLASDMPVSPPRPALALAPLPMQRSARETTPCACPRCSALRSASTSKRVPARFRSRHRRRHRSSWQWQRPAPPPASLDFLSPKHQHPRRAEACPGK
jgi:hypothetical protein